MAGAQSRGPYAKGTLKRAEILDKAVESIGKFGYHATSMREIAKDCGLTPAGLKHYFPDKETLLVAVLQRREESQLGNELVEPAVWFSEMLAQEIINESQKPLAQLWSSILGQAMDDNFPANEYFLTRYRQTRKDFAQQFAHNHDRTEASEEDEIKAALMTAMWDGLQNQWLLDPTFDMRRSFRYALTMLMEYSARTKE